MRALFLVLFSLAFPLCLEGQTISTIEKQLIKYSNEIDRWDTLQNEIDGGYDSLALANKRLVQYLSAVCSVKPEMLRAQFNALQKTRIRIKNSDDNKIRIFWWDVCGGNVRSFDAVLVYAKANSKVGMKILNDDSQSEEGTVCSGSAYNEIYSINALGAGRVYLVTGSIKAASGLYYNELTAYSIINDKLVTNFPFFKTTVNVLGSIGFETDYSIQENRGIVNYPFFKLSKDKQVLYVPLIKESGRITNKYLVYKFNGHQFVFDKNAK